MKRRAVERCKLMWTLLLSGGTVYALVLVFRWHDYDPSQPNRFDSRLLAAMGIVYAATAITMLIHNDSWPIRAHGQFLTYVGDALFWAGLGFSRLGWRHRFTVNDLTWIRAIFVVAVILLGFAVILINVTAAVDRWERWRESRRTETILTDDLVVTQVPVDRRSGVERRAGWDKRT